MKTLKIVYFSQGGSTHRVATKIADGCQEAGYQSELINLKEAKSIQLPDSDLLGIGFPVYYFRAPFNILSLLKEHPSFQGRRVFIFSVNGSDPFTSERDVMRILKSKGANICGFFRCNGAEYNQLFLQEGVLFSPESPTEKELQKAFLFGKKIAASDGSFIDMRISSDGLHGVVTTLYCRLVRLLTSRPMSVLYSKLFRVNRSKCVKCGECEANCPTGNIHYDSDGYPVWQTNCLLCLSCEMRCKSEAIRSPLSWTINRPLSIFGIKAALKDANLAHCRVTHSHGKTEIIKK